MEYDGYVDWRRVYRLYQLAKVNRRKTVSRIVDYLSNTNFNQLLSKLKLSQVLTSNDLYDPVVKVDIVYDTGTIPFCMQLNIRPDHIDYSCGFGIPRFNTTYRSANIPAEFLEEVVKRLNQSGIYIILFRVNNRDVYTFNEPLLAK